MNEPLAGAIAAVPRRCVSSRKRPTVSQRLVRQYNERIAHDLRATDHGIAGC